jgi:hypothetical protein
LAVLDPYPPRPGKKLDCLLIGLAGFYGLDPLMQAVGGHAEPLCDFGDAIAAFNDLPHGFVLKFWGITLGTHPLPPMLVE